MAYVCPHCRQIHPEGSGSCLHAKELIDKRTQKTQMRIIAHQENCDCPSPEEHLRKRDREKQRRRGGLWDNRPIGASV